MVLLYLRDASTGRELRQFVGHTGQVFSVAFSPDGRFVLTGSNDKTARLWETATGHEVQRFKKDDLLGVTSIAFSPDGRFVLTGSYDDNTRLWEVSTGQMVRQITKSTNELAFVPTRTIAFSPVAFSPDGRFVLTGGKSYETAAWLWDTATGRELRQFVGHTEPVDSVAFSPDGRFVLTGSYDKSARLWETATGSEIQRFEGHTGIVDSVAFSPDGSYVLTGSQDTTARLWETATGREVKRFEGNMSIVDSIAFSPDGQLVLSASADGTVKLWDKERGLEICRLLSFLNGTWAVITPDGRFDTNNLEEFLGMYWVMPDDPFRPLPPEIFMRDYYEPQLLPKVLSGKEFKPIRPLAELNRVQPGVKILKVEKGATPDIAKVTVEVSGAEGTFQREGKDVVMKTGVHDLRLYRNGQLVGQWPEAGELTYKSLNTTSEEELNAWRKATEIPLDPSSKATKTFTVRLPRREDLKEVAFSTYAFNLDRVKSETARQKYKVPEKLKQVKGRAYVITVGVSGNEDLLWQLIFASEDAKLIQRAVVKKLEDSKRYEKVVPVCLITTPPGSEEPEAQAECNEFIRPTKENIKTVLDILAGRTVEAARLEQLPPKLRPELRQVQPEDLVLLSFSSHGLTDINGEFYLLPYDLGMDSAGKVTPELLRRSISSQELSLWLSPIDAEQLMMVVDACHSAAAVEAEGFKPGPMGNPGLGQLSYDKGMPILVATQASASAWAERYSLLTLALAQEGIGEKHLELTEALRYAEQRVPKLYEEKIGKEETKKIQVPKLFEFRHP